jgi:branched-chain amino acid transport system substrate-binding protein
MAGLLALTACGTGSLPTGSVSPTDTSTPSASALQIGTLIPSTGALAFLGPAQTAGVALAVQDINAAGGVNGVPVTVVAGDSADASTTTAETTTKTLISKGVGVIIGPSTSVLAERVIPLTVAAKIPLISPAATLPALTQAASSNWFFRTVPAYEEQGTVLGQVLSESGTTTAAIVYTDDALGKSLQPTFSASLAAAGSTLVASVAVPTETTDVAPFVAKVVAAKPQVVVLASSYGALDLTKALIGQLIGAGFGGNKLWLTSQNTGDYSQALAAGLLTGVNGIIEGADAGAAFTARLKTVDSTLADVRYAAEAYDSTILAALAAVVARDSSGPSIAENLRSVSTGGIKCTSFAECVAVLQTQQDIDYDGVSGPVDLTANGDVSPASYGLYAYGAGNQFTLTRDIIAGRP